MTNIIVNSSHSVLELVMPTYPSLPILGQRITITNSSIVKLDGIYEVQEYRSSAIIINHNKKLGLQSGEYTLSATMLSNMELIVQSREELDLNLKYHVPCNGKIFFLENLMVLNMAKRFLFKCLNREGESMPL